MISSVLTLWVCRGLLWSVTVFFWMSLFFVPFDLTEFRDVPSRRGSSKYLVIFVIFLMSQVLCVTVFVPKLVFRPLLLLLAYVMFRLGRLFRGSNRYWVNTSASSVHLIAPFWISEFPWDLFGLWRSLFECACFSILLIFGVYVMFRSERGCSGAPPRNRWTLVARAVDD